MTVAELLTGVKQPLSTVEFGEWSVFFQMEAAERAKKK